MDPVWLLEITKNSHILDHVNTEYPELNIYISELILDSYEYIAAAAACMKMHCVI